MQGEDLKSILKSAGIKQREFAARLGVEETTVSRWVKGHLPVPAYVVEILRLYKLADDMVKGIRQ